MSGTPHWFSCIDAGRNWSHRRSRPCTARVGCTHRGRNGRAVRAGHDRTARRRPPTTGLRSLLRSAGTCLLMGPPGVAAVTPGRKAFDWPTTWTVLAEHGDQAFVYNEA